MLIGPGRSELLVIDLPQEILPPIAESTAELN